MSVGTCFERFFGAAGAEKLTFWRRRRRKFGFGGGFRAKSLRKMHQNSGVKSITFQWIFGIFGFPEVHFQVFFVFLDGSPDHS